MYSRNHPAPLVIILKPERYQVKEIGVSLCCIGVNYEHPYSFCWIFGCRSKKYMRWEMTVRFKEILRMNIDITDGIINCILNILLIYSQL